MTKILVINGVNLNMLGIREPALYGTMTLSELEENVGKYASTKNVEIEFFQSNYEGAIVESIQQAYGSIDGIIINAGAYTHTSIAILDALKSVNIRTIEVHLTDLQAREDFRKKSYISMFASKYISGLGINGYYNAIDSLIDKE